MTMDHIVGLCRLHPVHLAKIRPMDRAPSPPSHKVDQPPAFRPRWRVWAKIWLIGGMALALLVWAGNWVSHRWTHIVVDDARVDGEVITISSRVSGWLTDLSVIEGDPVKA